MNNASELLITTIKAALGAGQKIMEIYSQDFDVDFKADQSPLTLADQKGNDVIMSFLNKTQIPIISEENKQIPYEIRKNWTSCWIVDPLDGTKEFVKRNGEFTVNIALVENGEPVLGVVYVPVQEVLYFSEKSIGSYKVSLRLNEEIPTLKELQQTAKKLGENTLPEIYTIVASRSHLNTETQKFIENAEKKHGKVNFISKGSSLKICEVAEGNAHVYPRIAPTMEWDTAAGHAVAKLAGCEILEYESKTPLKYNKENLLNPYFIVWGKSV